MAYKNVFKRYELKYIINKDKCDLMLRTISPYMEPDSYGITTVRNLYFDTPSYRLIRDSIEKPIYKEKLRIRSYADATPSSTVFVELKKKFDGVVYKRRIAQTEEDAMDWIVRGRKKAKNTQISREIDYFLKYYGELAPTVFLSYDRVAYFDKNGSDLRITFDRDIRFRENDLSLLSPVYGTKILPDDLVLMEIKASLGLPLWLTRALSENGIYKTSFSKYGTAYKDYIFLKMQKSIHHNTVTKEICNA